MPNAFSSDILDALNDLKDRQHVKTHIPSPSSSATLSLSRRPRRTRTCSQKPLFRSLYSERPALLRATEERKRRGGAPAHSEEGAVRKVRAAHRRAEEAEAAHRRLGADDKDLRACLDWADTSPSSGQKAGEEMPRRTGVLTRQIA